jgi:hypothetical protein
MDHDELREHIHSARSRGSLETGRIAARIVNACWPGGPEDRSESAARDVLRRWRSDVVAPDLPSCSTGRCIVCN